ncbi:MAG: FAD-binding oxidoreductase [Deltaproteobacteria bacterium]|nr:FAD-binding oxidoreductase [Deltaproteobacteria bacterium]
MKKIFLDEISLTATCPATLLIADLETYLRKKKYTLGYQPEAGTKLTLQKALEKRMPNRWAARYGEIDNICMALSVNTPFGPIQTRRAPRAATGPDFKKIFIGSSKKYGTLQEVILRVSPRPEREIALQIRWKKRNQEDFLKRFLGSGVSFRSLQKMNSQELEIELCGSRESVEAGLKTVHKMVKETGGTCSMRRGR